MLLPDINRIFEHWKGFPPVRRLVAIAIGFKPPERTAPQNYLTGDEFKNMVAALNAGLIQGPGGR